MRSQILIHPEELSKNWIDRIADAGVTVLGIHPWGGKHAEKSIQQMLEFLKTPEYRGLLDYAAERGLEIEYEIHAAGYLLPRDLFETHPEYFRMNENGERTPEWNFCVSDPKALSFAEIIYRHLRSPQQQHFTVDTRHPPRVSIFKITAVRPFEYTHGKNILSVIEQIGNVKFAWKATVF